MNMTVAELLDLLADADPDAEIRIATQPAYPLRAGVAGIVTDLDGAVGVGDPDPTEAGRFVWIVATGDHAGDSDPYAPAALWEIAEAGR